MVKTKITLDDGRVRKIEDCELVVAIGLGSKKEEQQIQFSCNGWQRIKKFCDDSRFSRCYGRCD